MLFQNTGKEKKKMSKKELSKRLEKIEEKLSPGPDETIVLKMWCPRGRTTHPNKGRIRIVPSNPEDAEP
jgi:hypothetical protein